MGINSTPRALLLLLVPLFVLGTGCRHGEQASGVATALSDGAAGTTTRSAQTSEANLQSAYARCLREHGIEVADPPPGESVKIEGDKSPELRMAIEACREVAPASEAKDKLDPAQLLAYAVCMRANGFPEFPDPDAEGNLLIPKAFLRLPAFEAAERICVGVLGKPTGGTNQK